MTNIPDALAEAVNHHRAGRLMEAERLYRLVLRREPEQFDALQLLGVIAHQSGRHEDAVAWIGRAVALKPDHPSARNNLGEAYRALGRLDEAIECYRRAVALKPDYVEAHHNLGAALKTRGQSDEAIACYRRALALSPDRAEIHNNLGNVLKSTDRLDEAVACYRRAIALKPDYAEAFSNLGNALNAQGCLDEALDCYRRAIALRPDYARAHSNLVYALAFHPDATPATILEEARRWDRRHAAPLAASWAPHPNDRSPERRLRVGYISPDFRDHCQANFMAPLLSHHDHERFEIVCYADVPSPDATTALLRPLADAWRPIAGLSDGAVAELIRRDRIDILVDLTMHMADNRLLVFARKPAPVQICWLAYPGTTGLSAIDYRLTDPHLDPPGQSDRDYSETSIRLPDGFWCYDPLASGPAVNPLPALSNGFVTFGSLHNSMKVNDRVLALWARVLRAVAGSRLLLLAAEGTPRRRAAEMLGREGIGPDRLEFVARRPRPEYLALYQRVDIGLDTFPANGHTTGLDSAWMGVPVVTLAGPTAIGRGGLCQLRNLGLPDLIAESPDQFVRIAADLAGDLPRLARLRAGLRDRLEHSPLMDAPRFARNIEAAYRAAWRKWCAGATGGIDDEGPEPGSDGDGHVI